MQQMMPILTLPMQQTCSTKKTSHLQYKSKSTLESRAGPHAASSRPVQWGPHAANVARRVFPIRVSFKHHHPLLSTNPCTYYIYI